MSLRAEAMARKTLPSARLVVWFDGGHRVVASTRDAAMLLMDWPADDRGMTYGVAARIIEAALRGRASEREALSAVKALCVRSASVVRG